jgi:hypothetical protein
MSEEDPNPLIRLFLNGAAIGFALSAAFIVILWLTEFGNLIARAGQSDDGFLLLFILWFSNGLLFAAVQIGYAVWQMGRDA